MTSIETKTVQNARSWRLLLPLVTMCTTIFIGYYYY